MTISRADGYLFDIFDSEITLSQRFILWNVNIDEFIMRITN